MLTRRTMLMKLALGAAGVASGAVPFRLGNAWSPRPHSFSSSDDSFLNEVSRASFDLFWENSHPRTGLVKDVVVPGENAINAVSSIAATGFGLTALCIGAERGWANRAEALERVRTSLRFLHNEMPHEHGFFHHFVDWQSGQRAWMSEVSSIDTAILICGVLTCRQFFQDDEVRELAGKIYDRVDWRWLYQDGPFMSHGWTPERGFLLSKWDSYSEHMMLYLLAIGSNTHAIPSESWKTWSRPRFNFAGGNYIEAAAPIFIHQYSHAWFDFRGQQDAYANYFENSATATRAHRNFCTELSREFPTYTENLWGITASESPKGYAVWGGPPKMGPIDGSVVPCAAGGSLPFAPEMTLHTLRYMRERHAKQSWTRYGFADAFNPGTGWAARPLIAINTGITLLMAENARSGFVWENFMRNRETKTAMQKVGFNTVDDVFKSPILT